MSKTEEINHLIKLLPDTNEVSDGYHTFGELYQHRCLLWILICEMVVSIREMAKEDGTYELLDCPVWKSKYHSDGTIWKDWFILGLNKEQGKQITYHLPIKYWEMCNSIPTLDKAPEWDKHTSQDVVTRLTEMINE